MLTHYCVSPAGKIGPIALQGMVTAPHYLASQAGLDILRRGGNAVDAAIATSATLSVVYPHMCTLGGDNFWLIFDASSQTLHGLNASGRAAFLATVEYYTGKGLNHIPSRGWDAAITVPGAVSGWDEAFRFAHEAMPSSMKWSDLFASPIEYSRHGCPVSTSLAQWSAIDASQEDKNARFLQRFPELARIFFPGGSPLRQGSILRQPDLARSLESIALHGASEFYTGTLAHAISDDMTRHNGLLTLDDLACHHAEWVTPLSVDYRGFQAYNLPPNTQGIASLEILNILHNFDVLGMGESSADHIHTIVEATKEAFLDRDAYISDPDFVHAPLDFLLSSEHGKRQAERIDMTRSKTSLPLLDPNGDTVWLGVVDKYGNAVSLIQSIYHDFGSGIIPSGTGIILQNRGCFFSLQPDHVNKLQPGKRTMHTLNPAMLLKDGKPWLVYGTMGGEGQPQTQAAMVTRIVDFGMTPQEAITAPRWLYGRTWGSDSNDLRLEGRFAPDIVEELRHRGHTVNLVEDYAHAMGHAGAICIDVETGLLQGGCDPRSDGLSAVGY